MIYDASHIQVLKGIEAVRKRPGMYVGDTSDGTGLHHMLYGVLDYALDEMRAGFVTEIVVSLNADGSATVRDNGRGLPTEIHPKEGISAAEVVMTQLYGGGKCGFGLSVMNALSTWLDLKIWSEGREHLVRFRDGIAEAPLEAIGTADGKRGMEITFRPSLQVFHNVTELDYATLEGRLRELACLHPGLRIVLQDGRQAGRKPERMCYGGIADLVRHLDRGRRPLLDAPIVIAGDDGAGDARIDVRAALWWNDTNREQVLCFANDLPQRDGGTHLAGFHAALARAITRCTDNGGIAKEGRMPITGDDARLGLTAVLAIRMQAPQFSSATAELLSPEAEWVVERIVSDRLAAWLGAHPKQARVILAKAHKAAAGRAVYDLVRHPPAWHP